MNESFSWRPATDADGPAIRELVFATLQEFGLQPDPETTDADLFALEASYTKRGGRFDVALDTEGRIIGCVGLYPLEAGVVELRKMYLASCSRGRGLGKRLLQHAMEQACIMGYREVVLETADVLQSAVRLYESYGFERYEGPRHASRTDATYRLRL